MSQVIWDREPLWEAVKEVLRREKEITAGDLTEILKQDGWEPGPGGYILAGRVYQLMRERTITGEVIRVEIPGSRAKVYRLATDMPKITVRFTPEQYAELWKLARKCHTIPQELAGRILTEGAACIRKVVG